ncbi:hypothetical protein E4U19_004080 [Claviceps sp. Clav32 group G5]|nr:hypothetical protein E4U59_006151 [Claviceps monticola]KAG6023881.1 hypothetical protein E4U19_004080 [Claviceps sp. Clav32 group G5]KAG6032337.1 hypothetical protein E4U40_006347 [Claviceps sp. LM458 group G5]KAG6044930.1 hypothetical protein E4U39_002892 [Claviceps sp. Clav50 group G5]KAG6052734.1 hypothetical protein E4U17_005481 [Claviceps sp. LM77 group G4]KAG6071360.1 hypothetical protein E4U33_003757 [Claviceps sp. LM78 group G4]KAG6072852.1 hypothetical protein E4U16_005065 [Clavic
MASSDKLVEPSTEDKKPEQKMVLGEDDEFEDFPVDDWPDEQTEAAQGGQTNHLWEESWDDDDTTDDFSVQLR